MRDLVSQILLTLKATLIAIGQRAINSEITQQASRSSMTFLVMSISPPFSFAPSVPPSRLCLYLRCIINLFLHLNKYVV